MLHKYIMWLTLSGTDRFFVRVSVWKELFCRRIENVNLGSVFPSCFWVLNTIISVLSFFKFSISSLSTSQLGRYVNSSEITLSIAFILLLWKYMMVLSAYVIILHLISCYSAWLKCKINNRGPRMNLWGTPL